MTTTKTHDRSRVSLVAISSADDALPYAALTYAAYQPLLLQANGSQALAVGAVEGGEPVGLALASKSASEPAAEIVSLFVAKSHRGQGIAAALLAEIEQRLVAAGAETASIVFPSGDRPTEAAERLLARTGWSKPEPRMHLLRMGEATHRLVRRAKWLEPRALPPEHALFPWTELRDDERDALLAEQRAAPWFPEYLSPFREPHLVDANTSLGLRHRGRVAGWIVTHRIRPDLLRYTSLFVRPETPGRSAWLCLLREAVMRHLTEAAEAKRASLGVAAGNPIWGFLERRLIPLAEVESIVTTMACRKRLYRHLGIDPGLTFPDYSGRPRHLLEEREPIVEL